MDIKEFVKESLMQIAESINEANVELEEKGTYIPNGDMTGEGVLFTVVKGTGTRHVTLGSGHFVTVTDYPPS